jgi:uncharacterized membrane protein YdbT with pleckstrin-like domain
MLNRPTICSHCGQEIKRNLAGSPPAAAGEEETDVFNLHPSALAFLGELILGIILLPIFVGLFVLLRVWHKCASRQYRLTTQRLFLRRGVIAKDSQELELYRVKDVTVTQSFLQRLMGYGSITILSDDESNPRLTLIGVRNPVEVKETLRTHYRAARKREGVRPMEIMPT